MTRSVRRLWPLYAFGTACALTTAALLVWPQDTASRAAPEPSPAFAGQNHRPRTVAPSTKTSPLTFANAADPTAGPTMAAGVPTLVGVLGGREAWLRSAASGSVERVRSGEEFEGWRLIQVFSTGVAVSKGDETRELRLYQPSAVTGSPVVAPVQPGPMSGPQPPYPMVPAPLP